MMRRLVTILTIVACGSVAAIDTDNAFSDPELQARYERLITEVRCVTCQNQNIRDSNAFIAADLRREIRRLITEGKSDQEVSDYLVQRYGDFVLYRPRFSGMTAWLWIAPLALLGFGLFAVLRIVRRRADLHHPAAGEEGT